MSDLSKAYKTVMDDHFPDEMTISFGGKTLNYKKRVWKLEDEGALVEKGLRYGENPGQEAALYELVHGNISLGECSFIESGLSLASGISEEQLIQFGKHPGKTNLTDIDNALNIMKYLMKRPASIIVKHNNPSGAAYGTTLAESFVKAYHADRIAAFGGCVVFNRPLDKETAELVSQEYFEVVCAPEFADGTVEILKKRKNLRIVKIGKIETLETYKTKRFIDFKSLIDGGIIVQQSPLNIINSKDDFKKAECDYKGTKYAVKRSPSESEYEDMLFGWFVEQGVTSNSVLFVKDGVTVGIGTGEQDRVGVAEIAIFKAYVKYSDNICIQRHGMSLKSLELAVIKGEKPAKILEEIRLETRNEKAGLPGSCMISDAFFPFRDGVDVAFREEVRTIVQPGGSMRDYEVIEACNENDAAMVFTGQRAFKH
jgi:phosphoribosylaminoimidazolecarboxamide formyltransferase / IMP cyclohydrolase